MMELMITDQAAQTRILFDEIYKSQSIQMP